VSNKSVHQCDQIGSGGGKMSKEEKMKVLKWIEENLEEFLMCILLVAMACIMIVQIICRFVFSNSLGWSEELTRYLFVWSTFLSISYCIRKNLSIRIDLIVEALPGGLKKAFYIAVDLVVLVTYAYLVQPSFKYLNNTITNGQVSTAMQIPMAVIYAAPCVGFVLAVIRSAEDIILQATNKTAARPDPEEG